MTIDLSEKRRRRKNERNAAMYDQDVFDLLQAIDTWRRKNDRSFPAWSEVLQILKSLGWRKVEAADAKGEVVHDDPKAEESTEAARPHKAVEPMLTAKALPPAPRARKS